MKKTLLLTLLFCAFFGLKAQYKVDEGFEGATFPPTGWTTKSPVPTYPWFQDSPGGYGLSTFSAIYNFYNNNTGTRDSLVTPAFTASVLGDSIKFDQAYATYETEVDSLVIMAFDGVNYTTVVSLAGGPDVGTGMVTAAPTSDPFIPIASDWVKRAYAIPAGTVKIKFYVRSAYGNLLWIDNVTIGTPASIDAAVTSVGSTGLQFFASTTVAPTGIVKNNGVTPATFTVTRTITPGGYVSTKNVIALGAGASQTVTYDDWVFTSGVTYTVKDSLFLVGDSNPANDTLSGSITPNIPKTIAIVNGDDVSRDSLVAHMTLAGITSDYYDILTSVHSFRLWKTTIVLFASTANWSVSLRDSLKAAMDAANDNVNKKSFLIFGNDLGYNNDPRRNTSALAADTIFYRQYLKAQYWSDDWIDNFVTSDSTAKGIVSPFTAITGQRVRDPYPDCISPAYWNAGSGTVTPALIPVNESGEGDSCIAVAYSGQFYNTFYGTNAYSNYVPTETGILSPQGVIFNIMRNYLENNGGQLPVELASFTSSIDNRKVILNWSTTSEENNSGFSIERKLASTTEWSAVGNVTGAGNSNSVKNYTFSDNNVATGKYNYRLKQTDFNGNYKYYNLANEVNIGVPNKFALAQNYPNPFNPSTNINYDLPFDSKVSIKIFDMTGREVALVVNQVQAAGYYSINFNASALSSGVYFYQLNAEGSQTFVKTMKMVLVK